METLNLNGKDFTMLALLFLGGKALFELGMLSLGIGTAVSAMNEDRERKASAQALASLVPVQFMSPDGVGDVTAEVTAAQAQLLTKLRDHMYDAGLEPGEATWVAQWDAISEHMKIKWKEC